MRKIFYLFLFLLSSYNYVFAQSKSGSVSITEASIDKQLDEIIKVSKTFTESKQEKRLLKLMSESEKIGYDWGILRSGHALTSVYLGEGKYQKTIDLANQLKKVAKNKKDIYGYISSIHRRSALALGYVGLNDASLKDFNRAIKYSKEIENDDRRKHQLAFNYENINIYYENKEKEPGISDTILSNYLKSLEIAKTISDSNAEVSIDDKYGLIAYLHMSLGFFYLEHSNLELAEKYLLDAKKIYENKKYKTDPEQKAETFNELSKLYIKKKEYQNAIKYANDAVNFEKQHNFPNTRKQSYEYLLQAYLEIGNSEKAMFYKNKYTILRDSLAYEERKTANTTMKKMVTEADNEHKESSKKQWIITVVLALIAAGCTLIVWRRRNKILRKNYEQMIDKLKKEQSVPLLDPNDYNEELETIPASEINNEQSNSLNKNIISSHTEAKILKRLQAFEQSEKFLRRDLTVGLLASQLSTNSKYLSEIIKNNKSLSFSNYINSLRINYIVHKLYNEPKYRGYKISYLAEACGYASPQVFVVAFKKVNGVTPSYFIQNLNDEHINALQ